MCFPVNKCCFVFNLDTGSRVISALNLIWSLASVVVYSGAAMGLPAAAHARQCFYLMVAAVALGQFVTCTLLIHGNTWNKPGYLRVWLVTTWVLLSGLLVLSLLGVVLLTIQYYEDMETFTSISVMSTYYFVYAAIMYYCTLVVDSRRLEMIRGKETESADQLVRLRRQEHVPKSLLV